MLANSSESLLAVSHYQQHRFVWVPVCLAVLQPHQLFCLNLLVSFWANRSQEACRKTSSYWEGDSAKNSWRPSSELTWKKERKMDRKKRKCHRKSLSSFVPSWNSQPSKFGWCVEVTTADPDCCSTLPENTQLKEVAKVTKRHFYVLSWSTKTLDQKKSAQTIWTPVLLFGHCLFPAPEHSPCSPCWKKDLPLANIKGFWKRFVSCFPS